MKNKFLKKMVVTLVVLLLMGDAIPADVEEPASGQQLELTLERFASNEVWRVDILEMNPGTITRTSITPEMLEKSPEYRLTINMVPNTKYWQELRLVLTHLTVAPVYESRGDMRWGIIFFGQYNYRIGGLYFDASGRLGAVNNLDVSFKNGGDVVTMLANNFFRQMNSVMDCRCPATENAWKW
ncbi:hypothetical protein ISP15_06670 [Dyella jejuensis]|uniref:Uncharacterized protein n=1 Tax=Dyella jejuensis TaxID=1432009 RepID=A0ABW8JG26_9GAMM